MSVNTGRILQKFQEWEQHRFKYIVPGVRQTGSKMDKLNLQLYWHNYCIIKENERLRKKAQQLNQENQALLSELRQKLAKKGRSNPDQGPCLCSTSNPNYNQPHKP
ncbi:hypothetical protein ES319_A12G096900v1 [Gossypium barbadense]|uniref:Protein LITTLE ZIPPER 4 n=2 Tax=Gossypium TaxID=3633 RepID=A0A5J5TC84_GOSBA|nr:hypothetical protein ES319_A12G096900v1 [Gossypium barbadense]TYG89430.1 hypothetical protein ES288_A12G099200v1 [Gossypium darwinii]